MELRCDQQYPTNREARSCPHGNNRTPPNSSRGYLSFRTRTKSPFDAQSQLTMKKAPITVLTFVVSAGASLAVATSRERVNLRPPGEKGLHHVAVSSAPGKKFMLTARTTKSVEFPRHPREWPHVFETHLNAGNLEAVLALYDEEARFVSATGEIIVGRENIRPVLAKLIASKARFYSRVFREVMMGDTALLYTDFEGTVLDASGQRVEMNSKAIELLRRQPDGTWKLIFGDPQGRAQSTNQASGATGPR